MFGNDDSEKTGIAVKTVLQVEFSPSLLPDREAVHSWDFLLPMCGLILVRQEESDSNYLQRDFGTCLRQ